MRFMSKKYFLLLSTLFFFSFMAIKTPAGWEKIDKAKVGKEKLELYFFDYMTRLEEARPDFSQLKGRDFTNALQQVQFRYPAYVAKRDLNKVDSVIYYVLRPDEAKSDQPFYFDLEIIKAGHDFSLDSLERKSSYENKIIKIVPAIGCRGALVYENNLLVQKNPDKDKLIGNGIQIAEGIFTRVIPFEEIKKPFLRLIESNL